MPGSERPPKKLEEGTFSVPLGRGAGILKFQVCPVGTLLTDEVCTYLSAYHSHQEFRVDIPGRKDPRLISAFFVIQSEYNKITSELQEDAMKGSKGG